MSDLERVSSILHREIKDLREISLDEWIAILQVSNLFISFVEDAVSEVETNRAEISDKLIKARQIKVHT